MTQDDEQQRKEIAAKLAQRRKELEAIRVFDPTRIVAEAPLRPSEVVMARVAELRKRQGWSAQDLAERCAAAGFPQLDRAILANMESRRRQAVTVDEAMVLAKVLNVSLLYLLFPVDPQSSVKIGDTTISARDGWRWLRGEKPLPDQDRRIFRSEVSDDEWATFEKFGSAFKNSYLLRVIEDLQAELTPLIERLQEQVRHIGQDSEKD